MLFIIKLLIVDFLLKNIYYLISNNISNKPIFISFCVYIELILFIINY